MNRYALLMYACMFASIWTGDSWLLPLLGGDHGVVYMRVVSLVLYLVFGGLTFLLFRWWRGRRYAGDSIWEAGLLFSGPFLRALCLVGFVCFVAGFALVELGVDPASRYVGFALTKVVGVPFSIGAVYILGQLPRPYLLQTISSGTFGAFLMFATAKYIMSSVVGYGWVVLLSCSVLFVASFYCGIRCASVAGLWSRERLNVTHDVVGRPLGKVLRAPIVLGILMVSTMLGFVRNTTAALAPSDALAVASVVFMVMVFVRLYRGNISLGYFFQAGVICLAVSVLVVPIAAVDVSTVQSVLAWAASACLETVAICMCSWSVHNSRDALMAAVLSRICMVTGHLLGTLLVQMELALSTAAPDGITGGSLLLMFLFVLLMLFSYQVPQLQVMLFSVPPRDFYGQGPSGGDADGLSAETDDAEEEAGAAGEDAGAGWRDYRDYHQRSCDIVSQVYGLTKREAEVLYMLSQGRTIGYMQEHFVLSQNTLKMHIRHIYQKLDVHSKQEVIDIVAAAQEQAPPTTNPPAA